MIDDARAIVSRAPSGSTILNLFELDVVGILSNVGHRGGDSGAVLQGDVAQILQQEQGAGLVGGIVGHGDQQGLASAAGGKGYDGRQHQGQGQQFGCELFHNTLLLYTRYVVSWRANEPFPVTFAGSKNTAEDKL